MLAARPATCGVVQAIWLFYVINIPFGMYSRENITFTTFVNFFGITTSVLE
jgi:hypothetical protein